MSAKKKNKFSDNPTKSFWQEEYKRVARRRKIANQRKLKKQAKGEINYG